MEFVNSIFLLGPTSASFGVRVSFALERGKLALSVKDASIRAFVEENCGSFSS